jgi:hypothetical protein
MALDAPQTTQRSDGIADGLTRDVLMGEFLAATSVNEEVGEVFEDLGRFATLVREHGRRQVSITQRWVGDLASVRSFEQLLAVQLHALRTTADNQMGFVADTARLQADAINRTRHMLAVGFATLERALSGKTAARDHGAATRAARSPSPQH